MGTTNSKELVRPGDPRVPCFAILDGYISELKLVNLEGGTSNSVKIFNSTHALALGIITLDDEVYAVQVGDSLVASWVYIKQILKIGRKVKYLYRVLKVDMKSCVISFQKKIYIIQTRGEKILCFDPAINNRFTCSLPGCELGPGFCASVTDDFICAMGGEGTKTRAMKYDPLTNTWEENAPMRKERIWAAAATLDGKIYVMGGGDASAEYYNPGNNSWTEILNMNVDRRFFNACVVGGRLYAVGGDVGEKKNGFYEQSIEVYDKNKWTVVTKFQTKNPGTYSCLWPHGSHQPGPIDSALEIEDGAAVTLNNSNFSVQDGDKATTAVGIHRGAQGTVNIQDGNVDVYAGAKGAEK